MAEDKSKKEGLIRQLIDIDVFCIAAGAMISSGLFVLPAILYAKVGQAVVLVYILAGVLVLPALFSKLELSTAMPRAGGDYFFIERSMGSAAGTIGGFASWFSLSLKSAFALVGIGIFATLINPGISAFEIKLIAMVFCIFFTILNIVSVKFTGKIQTALVLLLITLLLLYIFRGLEVIHVRNVSEYITFDTKTIFAAAGMAFISFGGITKISSVAEEIKNPAKTITYGMIFAFCVVIILYVGTIFVTAGLLGTKEFAQSLTPISDGGFKMLGTTGRVIMSVAAILAFVTTANAGILSASRFPLAMSRDQLLPQGFSKIHKRFNTPYVSIIFTGAFMLAMILFLDLENLVKVASTMKIILFMFVILAAIIMRESRILNYKPTFTSPLYPWIQIAGVIAYGFLLYQMGRVAILATGIFFVVSMLWYKIYRGEETFRKAALIHIVERVTSKEIAGDSLGTELREILRERDDIVEDRFDELVKKSEIIDIGKPITHKEFFRAVAEKLSPKLQMSEGDLYNAFIAREKESTTEIRPGLAIPHITIGGKGKFELVLARCEAGIDFTMDLLPPVYAAFILVGSRDERRFHLRALSAIAQIVQNEDFDKNWLRAKNTEELRDIVLLGKRHRVK
ncbi:MAG: amino acid permease [bacterium]